MSDSLPSGPVDEAKRIDFHHAGIAFPPGLVKPAKHFRPRPNQIPLQAQRGRQLAPLKGHQAHGWIHRFFDDFFRMFGRHFLDVHAAFRAGHDHRAGGGAIQQNGAVKFLPDERRGRDEHPAHQPPLRAGLFGDEHLAQHRSGNLKNLAGRLAQLDAALEAAFESPLAAAAGVNLGFDGEAVVSLGQEVGGGLLGGLGRGANLARRHHHAVLGQQFFGLELVDIHCLESIHRREIGLTLIPTGPV